jgi:hypothetical protein
LEPGTTVTILPHVIGFEGRRIPYLADPRRTLPKWPSGERRMVDRARGSRIVTAVMRIVGASGRGAGRVMARAFLDTSCGVRAEYTDAIDRRVTELAFRLPDPDAGAALVGTGYGFTPAGDDVICGYLAAAWVTGLEIAPLERAVLARVPECTTRLAATTLRFAATGRVERDLHRIIVAVSSAVRNSRDRPTLEAIEDMAASYVARTGHSSGADAIAGTLLAFDHTVHEEESGGSK